MKFTPGGVGTVFASTGSASLYGLAFDGTGDLYAANSGDQTITKFNTTMGGGSLFVSTGLSSPTFLAFAPSPEPSQTAVLGLGFLVLGGLTLRARRRKDDTA